MSADLRVNGMTGARTVVPARALVLTVYACASPNIVALAAQPSGSRNCEICCIDHTSSSTKPVTVDRREAAALERIVPGFGTVVQRSDEGADPLPGVLADVALGREEAEIDYRAAGFAFGSRLAKSRPSQSGDPAAEFRSIPGLEWNSFTTAPGWYHTAPAQWRGTRR